MDNEKYIDIDDELEDEDEDSYENDDFGLARLEEDNWMLEYFFGTPDESFVVPSEIDGRKIVAIDAKLFYGYDEFKTVTVSEGIEDIYEGAFENCPNLEKIILPQSLNLIEARAFAASGIKKLTIPKNVTELGKGFCSNCEELTEVIFEGHLKAVPEGAFYCCESLKSVKLNSGLEKIEDNAFCGTGIEKIILPDGLKHIGKNAFASCYNAKGTVVIPKSVELIEERAFSCCSAEKFVFMPECAAALKDFAFSENIPESGFFLLIPPSITEIGRLFDDEADFNDASKSAVIICCEPGSCAMEYALKNKFSTADYYITIFKMPEVMQRA